MVRREVRVRFAPSPTGRLHLGGARTALFNYLYARYSGGSLILRIEDTDRSRSTRDFEDSQLEDLAWLGIPFDEGPYRQSQRPAFYERAAERSIADGSAYEATDEAGRRALYLRPAARSGSFQDELRGEVSFGRVEDFVILKSDGSPSYNFAAVVDDAAMGITHVIRGEEHLSNTARQTLLYEALGLPEPAFLHLGLILGPDGGKLSKRHGAESVGAYREEGYLPEALIEYLALLGWSHPEGREDFASLEDLAAGWDPSRLGASPATFDPDRLLYTNARRIRGLPAEELRRRLEPFLEEPLPEGRELVAVEAIRDELRTLADAPALLRRITAPVEPATFTSELPGSSAKVYEHTVYLLAEKEVRDLEDARTLLRELRSWAKDVGIKTRDLLHPLRLALTGRDQGPEMAYLFAVLGPDESRHRIQRAVEALR